MTIETYTGILTTVNVGLMAGLYKLILNHIMDRNLHTHCGKNLSCKSEGFVMKKIMNVVAACFLFVSVPIGCEHLQYIPPTPDTPSIVKTPIGNFEPVKTTNKVLDVLTNILTVVGGSATLAAIPIIRKIKPIVPLLDAVGANFCGAKNEQKT